MSNPITDILWNINHQVSQLSGVSLTRMTQVLDAAELELTRSLAHWKALGKGTERFTPQLYRNALIQIRGALDSIRGTTAEGVASALRHGGVLAGDLATKHLTQEVQQFSKLLTGTVRPVAFEAASVIAEGKKLVWPKFSNSAARYAGAVGEDIRKQLAIGVLKGETIDQLTNRLAKMGGPKGLVYTKGQALTPGSKAEYISQGLFNKYRHYGERLARTEVVSAYNSFAMVGVADLEANDPGYYKRWDAAIDGRTCPDCGALDDQVVSIYGNFRGGIEGPPLHPNCRCAVVVWRKEWTEHAYKDDLIKESISGIGKGVAEIQHAVTWNGLTGAVNKPEKVKKEPKAPKQPKAIKPKEDLAHNPALTVETKLMAGAKERFEERAQELQDKLTESERHAFGRYQGSGYGNINNFLRFPKASGHKKELYKVLTDGLDTGIAKQKAEKDILVYRGTKENILGKLKAGDIFQDKGYMSTSENPEIFKAGDFTSSKGVRFHIEIPKGYNVATMPAMGDEWERLLPRGSKLKILSIEDHMAERLDGTKFPSGQKIVRAKVIP